MQMFTRVIGLVLCGLAAQAAHGSDARMQGARECMKHFAKTEAHYQMPLHLLSAIASVESGRWHDGVGLALPWPWTINVEGKGYYFDSKRDAIERTRALLDAGKRSIDVGCMQVNLKHHPTAFRSLEEAFSPAHNVAYAAKFLRENYVRTGDWVQAAASYHSRTPKLGKKYLARVRDSWHKIVGRVQKASATSSESYKVVHANDPTPNGLDSTRNVKVISVADAPNKKESVLVVNQKNENAMPKAHAYNISMAGANEMLVKGTPAVARAVQLTKPLVDNAIEQSHKGTVTRFVFD